MVSRIRLGPLIEPDTGRARLHRGPTARDQRYFIRFL